MSHKRVCMHVGACDGVVIRDPLSHKQPRPLLSTITKMCEVILLAYSFEGDGKGCYTVASSTTDCTSGTLGT